MEEALLQKRTEVIKKADGAVKKKIGREDYEIANALVKCLRKIETFIFGEVAKINFVEEANSWGVGVNFYPEDGEYDIYLPELKKRFRNISIIFPEKGVLKGRNEKLILWSSHKVRHRAQKEFGIELFSPKEKTGDPLLDDIMKTVGQTEDKKLCSCSILDGPEKIYHNEIDALITQHYVLSRLGTLPVNTFRIEDIPIFVWKNVASDVLVQV